MGGARGQKVLAELAEHRNRFNGFMTPTADEEQPLRALMSVLNSMFLKLHKQCDNVVSSSSSSSTGGKGGGQHGAKHSPSRGPGGWGMTLFFVGKVAVFDFLLSNPGGLASARFSSFLSDVTRAVCLPVVKSCTCDLLIRATCHQGGADNAARPVLENNILAAAKAIIEKSKSDKVNPKPQTLNP
jgi:hypothetical protein